MSRLGRWGYRNRISPAALLLIALFKSSMPGVAGFLGDKSKADGQAILDRMLKSMMHEPFYISGNCVNADLGVHAGWVSKGETGGAWNETVDIGLLFSGDIVSGANREDRLRWLLAQYEKNGLHFLEKLNGWFGGLILDRRNRQVILFNDRYGLGRIYWCQDREGFYFSSEAKALLKVLPQTRKLDERGVAEWLSCGCVLQNRSLFSNVSLLPPGSAWTFSADGKITKRNYFEPARWESQPTLSPSDFYDRLKETFPRILKPYMNGEEPVAMSLTGGLDGRMIMSWSARAPGELPCYTFNGPVRDCADVKIGRRVAEACAQKYQTISVGDRFFSEFSALAEKTVYISDGAMDVTGSVELYVNRLARQIAPVRITGNYGSEILRGNVAFRARPLPAGLFSEEMMPRVAEAGRTYTNEAIGNRLSFIAFKQVPWHHYARFAVEQSQINVRSPFLDNELVALAFRASPEIATSLEPSLRLIAEGNPGLGRIPTDRGVTYPAGKSINRLHRSVQDFLAKAEYAYDYGMPDWLARTDKYLSPLHLEKLFLGRQKFCHFRSWYRRQLACHVRDILLDPQSGTRFYVNAAGLKRMVGGHIAGTRNSTLAIHKLLSLELVHRSLLRG